MYNVHIRQEFAVRSDQEANGEVERRGAAPMLNVANLSRSSTPLLDPTKTQPRDRSNRLLGLIPTIPARPREHCLSAHESTEENIGDHADVQVCSGGHTGSAIERIEPVA